MRTLSTVHFCPSRFFFFEVQDSPIDTSICAWVGCGAAHHTIRGGTA